MSTLIRNVWNCFVSLSSACQEYEDLRFKREKMKENKRKLVRNYFVEEMIPFLERVSLTTKIISKLHQIIFILKNISKIQMFTTIIIITIIIIASNRGHPAHGAPNAQLQCSNPPSFWISLQSTCQLPFQLSGGLPLHCILRLKNALNHLNLC